MNAKRIIKWGMVLCLLAALPGLTAALAQEPVTPQITNSWNVYESEPNNGFSSADPLAFGDVMGGDLEYQQLFEVCGSDYFHFTLPEEGYILIDISFYRGMTIDLYNKDGTLLVEQEFRHESGVYKHHLMFRNLSAGKYYIELWDDLCGEGYYFPYEFSLSRPLLVSAAAANLGTGTVAGIKFRAEDILAFSDLNNGEERWRMFFDGSDVGIVKNVANIAAYDNDRIAIGVSASQALAGVGTLNPNSIAIFDAVEFGENTSGAFVSMEAITNGVMDAYDFLGEETHAVSTATTTGRLSSLSAPNGLWFKAKDEDIVIKAVYDDEIGPWLYFDQGSFDGSQIAGLAIEDIVATAAYPYWGSPGMMTILGRGNVLGHTVTQKDIFIIDGYTWGGYLWRGPQHGWNYNIDAFDYPVGW